MPFTPPPSEENFAEASDRWDLERLYSDLGSAKPGYKRKKELTRTEKLHLRGLLCGYSSTEIADRLQKEARGVQTDLSKTLYRYIETLTDKPANSLKNWRDIIDWLSEAGYEKSSKSDRDWNDAPDVSIFYGRTEDLSILSHWIVRDRCRLVALLGISGIGKTALSVQLAKQIQPDFQFSIWRSLRYAPPLAEILADLIDFFGGERSTETLTSVPHCISQLMEFLQNHRCLLVFDSLEAILDSDRLAGQYRPGYENYGELIRRLGEQPHQSCLLFTSCEKPSDIALLEGDTQPVRAWQLTDLELEAANKLLKKQGLQQPEKWGELIRLYRGNPLALKMVSATIGEVFDGNVGEFLKQNTVYVGKLNKAIAWQFDRLSSLEKEIMLQLAIAQSSVSLEQLQAVIPATVRKSDLIEALESLLWRSLVEKTSDKQCSLFSLQPIIMKYVKLRLGGIESGVK